MRIDFALAEKKSPIYMSMYARLSIVGTKVILSDTHLTTDPDVGTAITADTDTIVGIVQH